MPGGLRDVEQRFGADASGYLAEISKIIQANREVLASIREVRKARIDVDNSGALAGIAEVRAALGSLRDKEITVTVKYVTVGDKPGAGVGLGADHAAMIRELRDISASMDMATTSMGNMETHLGVISRSVQDSSASLDMQTQMLRDNAAAHDALALAAGRSAAALAAAGRGGGGGGAGATALAAAAGAAAGGGGGGAAFAGGLGGTIFGGAAPTLAAAHMVTMLTMEVASQVIPAAVAAGAAAAVGTQGAVAAYQRGTGIYTAGEAFGGAYGVTPGQLFGMGSGFQVAQNQATGGVYGIIGSLMRMAGGGTGQGGILGPGGMGVQTVAMIDRGLANMVGSGRMSQLNTALGGGTGALQTIGDIGANLGDTLLNLAPVLPGMGSVLFGGLKAGTGLLRSATGLAGGGGLWPLLFGGGLAAEAGFRWGGPLLGGGKLPWFLGGGKFGGAAGLAERLGLGATGAAAGTDASGLAGFLAGGAGGLPIAGIAALAAASAYGISQGQFGTPAAGAMGGYMRNINTSFGATSLTPITKALYQAGQAQANLPGVSYETVAGQQVPVGPQIAGLMRSGYSPQQALAKVQAEYAANTQNLSTQLGQMTASAPAAQKALDGLGVKGATLAQAMDYMTMAMISPKDVGPGGVLDKTAMSQMASFVKTYSLMKSGGTTSASAITSAAGADYVMASPQMKALSQINSALDSMTSIMTGGPANASALTGIIQGIQTSYAPAPGVRGAPTATSAFARALGQGPFTPSGGAAWQAFTNPQTGLMAASQANMDQLRTFMTIGGLSGPQAGQLGAFELKQYAPLTSHSPMALAMLQQQAMQAGVPGVKMGQSYAATQRAINAHAGTLGQANQLMTQGTQAAANIPGVANFLNPNANISPLQSALYAQMAQNALAAAQHPTQANVSALQSSLGMSGVKPGQMQVGIDAILKNLHVPSNLIARINAEINPPKVPAVKGVVTYANNIPAPKPQHGYGVIHYSNSITPPHVPPAYGTIIYTPTIVGLGSVRTVTGGGSLGSLGGHTGQKGMRVPGFGGGDIFPAMLEPGEAVVPKHLVPSLAPFLGANKVPGFASGGLAGVDVPFVTGVGTAFRIAMQETVNDLLTALSGVLGQVTSGIRGPGSPFGSGGGFMRPLTGGPPPIGTPSSPVAVHVVRIGGSGSGAAVSSLMPGGGLPVPDAASKIFDAFEKTFKGMGSPWGKLASQILTGLEYGIRNAPHETAKMAQALVNKVTTEINFGKGVASAAVSGLNLPGMQVGTPTATAGGKPYQYYLDQQSLAGGGPPLSVQQQMGDYLQAMQSFQGDMGKLAKGGLSKALQQQLYSAGPVQGDALAQSILGGAGGIKGANQLWNQINSAATKLGVSAIGNVYGMPATHPAMAGLQGKTVKVGVHANTAAAQAAINAIHGKSVTVSVNLNISGGGGSGGGGGGGGLDLTPQQIKQVSAAVQAQLLKQAKNNRRTGLQLQGYGA